MVLLGPGPFIIIIGVKSYPLPVRCAYKQGGKIELCRQDIVLNMTFCEECYGGGAQLRHVICMRKVSVSIVGKMATLKESRTFFAPYHTSFVYPCFAIVTF